MALRERGQSLDGPGVPFGRGESKGRDVESFRPRVCLRRGRGLAVDVFATGAADARAKGRVQWYSPLASCSRRIARRRATAPESYHQSPTQAPPIRARTAHSVQVPLARGERGGHHRRVVSAHRSGDAAALEPFERVGAVRAAVDEGVDAEGPVGACV